MASLFFKPLFQIVLDPRFGTLRNTAENRCFHEVSVKYWNLLIFLIFRKRQIGIGSVLFRTWKQAWTLQLHLLRETLPDCCVL
jgi:hypothetical protein